MEWIEVTGRTVEDAKELALDRLGVVESELEFEIVEEPKSGLFGLRRTDARIRARVKPLSREKPGDRRRRRTQKGRSRREPAGAGAGSSSGSSPSKPASKSAAATDDNATEARPAGGSPSRSRGRRRGSGRGSGSGAGAGSAGQAGGSNGSSGDGVRAAPSAMAQEESTVVDEVPVEEQATAAEEFTVGLVEAFG